jgi:hypothetical protein
VTPEAFLDEWHRIVRERDLPALSALLAPEVEIGAPPYWEPLRGRELVHHLLGLILDTIEGFTYHREWTLAGELALEFRGRVGERPPAPPRRADAARERRDRAPRSDRAAHGGVPEESERLRAGPAAVRRPNTGRGRDPAVPRFEVEAPCELAEPPRTSCFGKAPRSTRDPRSATGLMRSARPSRDCPVHVTLRVKANLPSLRDGRFVRE